MKARCSERPFRGHKDRAVRKKRPQKGRFLGWLMGFGLSMFAFGEHCGQPPP